MATNPEQLIVASISKFCWDTSLLSIDNFVISTIVGISFGGILSNYYAKRDPSAGAAVGFVAMFMGVGLFTYGQICVTLIAATRIYIAYRKEKSVYHEFQKIYWLIY